MLENGKVRLTGTGREILEHPEIGALYLGGAVSDHRRGLMPDARVQAAIDHWAPRFIAMGVDYNDFVRTTGRIERWEDWLEGWSELAEEHLELAHEAERAGRGGVPARPTCTRRCACTSGSSSGSWTPPRTATQLSARSPRSHAPTPISTRPRPGSRRVWTEE